MNNIKNYFNPCASNFHAINQFKTLTLPQKILTCVATTFAILLTLPLLGIGGLPVFIGLTRKFSVVETTGSLPFFPSLSSLCKNGQNISRQISIIFKKFCSHTLSTNQKNACLKQINSLIEKNKLIGRPTLSTKFGSYGMLGSYSAEELRKRIQQSGFAIILPVAGKAPLLAIHDWKTDSWSTTDNEGVQKEFNWTALSNDDGVTFLSKIVYQPITTIHDINEHHSKFKVASYSNTKDKNTVPFYQEQQVGKYCGKHALNALLGYHHFNKTSWDQDPTHKKSDGASNVLSAWRELQKVEQAEKIPVHVLFDEKGYNLQSINEIVQGADRFAGGTSQNLAHWKTYRRDSSTGEWWCIDSIKQERINGQDTLYQYVVDIEQECGPARNRKAPATYSSGLIVMLTYEETIQLTIHLLQNMKAIQNLDVWKKNEILQDHLRRGLDDLLNRSESTEHKNRCVESKEKLSFGILEDMKENEFVQVLDDLIDELPKLTQKVTLHSSNSR